MPRGNRAPVRGRTSRVPERLPLPDARSLLRLPLAFWVAATTHDDFWNTYEINWRPR